MSGSGWNGGSGGGSGGGGDGGRLSPSWSMSSLSQLGGGGGKNSLIRGGGVMEPAEADSGSRSSDLDDLVSSHRTRRQAMDALDGVSKAVRKGSARLMSPSHLGPQRRSGGGETSAGRERPLTSGGGAQFQVRQ